MIKNLVNKLRSIRIALLHAAYHRNMKKAVQVMDSEEKDIFKFKKYIYRAEDAWKRVVKIKEKQK